MTLTFKQLRDTNVARCNSAFTHRLDEWSLTDWACALAGEGGEACNIIKKLRRGDYGNLELTPEASKVMMPLPDFDPDTSSWDARMVAAEKVRGEIAKELADVVCYCDLLAARAGIDLGEAVRDKFNEVSERRGSNFKL